MRHIKTAVSGSEITNELNFDSDPSAPSWMVGPVDQLTVPGVYYLLALL